jgi:hypothetical protein
VPLPSGAALLACVFGRELDMGGGTKMTTASKRRRGRSPIYGKALTNAERKARWRDSERAKLKLDPAFDPNADGMSVLMARALPRLDPKD